MNDLVVTPHPVTLEGRTIHQASPLLPGETLAGFLARHGVDASQEGWVVTIGGAHVPQLMWDRTRPHHGQVIEARRVAGKKVLYIVAIIVLAYFTFGAGLGAVGGAGAGAWGGVGAALGASGFTAFAINVGVYMIGSMLINKWLGPKQARMGTYDQQTATTYSLQGGRNRARPFEPLGLVFGVVKVVPDYAAQPYSWFDSDDAFQYIRLHAGINCGSVASIKIGNTPIGDFHDVVVSQSGFPGTTTQLEDWSNVDTIAGATLDAPTSPGAYTTRTSSANTTRLAIDIGAQLYRMRDDGGFDTAILAWDAERRLLPSGAWEPFDATGPAMSIGSKSTKPVRLTVVSELLPAGQYEVRLRKTTANVSTTREANLLEWGALKSYQLDTTDYSNHPHVGIRVKANGQINGTVDEVNWIATARETPVWNGSAWVTEVTRNPGAQILQFARGIYDDDGRLMAGMGLPDTQIDIEGLQAFMVHCAAQGYTFDYIFTDTLSCNDVMEAMAAAGIGSISHHPGKLSVVWAADSQPIEGVVAMGNIKHRSFRVDYATRETAEELEVTWPDRDTGWLPASVRVKAPGVTMPRDTARLAPAGVTTQAGGLLSARVAMAQNIYQRKSVSWEMDLEHVTFRRFSLISLSHDLTQWGYSGRLHAAVDVSGVVTLTLDEEVPAGSTVRYVGLRVPGETGYRVFGVAAFSGNSHTLTLTEAWPSGVPFPGDAADNPAHDYIWIYDFKPAPGQRLRIVSIEPTPDLSGAKLTGVPEPDEFWDYVASGVYEVPTGTYTPQVVTVSNLVVTQERLALNYDNATELSVAFDIVGPYDHAQVWANMDGVPLVLLGETRTRRFGPHRAPITGDVDIEVRPFDSLGRPGVVGAITYSIDLDAPLSAGNYTSFVFKRSATAPATPTGDTPAGWSDAPPADDGNPLWVSTALKTSTGTLIGVWSDPVQIDGKSLQVEYSVDGATSWHDPFVPGDLYARYRVGVTGTWSAAVKIVGEDGQDGAKAALVYIYKRSASAPALPTVNSTFTFATGLVTGMDNGWQAAVPAGSDPLYVTVASAVGTGTTDTITPGEWVSPTIMAQDGSPGPNAATVYLYQRNGTGTPPSVPAGSLTYTFASGLLSGTLGSWSQTIPGSGGKYLFVTTATAFSSGTTDTILTSEWATASVLAQDGDDGQKSALVYIYIRSATTPPLPTNDTTLFTFATGSVVGMNNGWQATVPGGSNPLWVSVASAVGTGTTDTITHTEWVTPTIMAQDGAPGGNSATVYLYQRNNTGTAPSVPGGTLTYTFATGVLSGSLGSWTQAVPAAAGGKFLFVTTATAFSSGATDTVLNSEWASPQVMAQDGTSGARGSLTGSSTAVSPAIYSTSPWNGSTDDSNASTIIWKMLGNGGSPPSNAHLTIGDRITMKNAANTAAAEKYWSGSAWVDVGTVFPGNVLVGGTISGTVNINITGSAKFEGVNSGITVNEGVGGVTRTVATISNTSFGAQIGVYGMTSASTGAGLHGESTNNVTGSVGVRGRGGIGVFGTPLGNGSGVQGEASATSGSAGVRAFTGGASTYGIYASTGFAAAGTAIYADGAGGTALQVAGVSTFSDRLTITLAGTATPIVLPVVAAKPAAINGGIALHSTYGLIFSNGTNWYAASGLQLI